MSKKLKHLLHFIKKSKTLLGILFKKMKQFLRLFKKHLKHFSPSVEKIDTLFAFSQNKIEYLLQLVKKIQNFFATFWKSKEIFHLSFIFFFFEFFGTFVNVWEKIDGLSKSFLLKSWHDHYLQIHNHQKNSQFFLTNHVQILSFVLYELFLEKLNQ